MGKNKKLIFVGIIITIIVIILLVIWRCSTSFIKKNETAKSQLPQATNEVTTQNNDSEKTEATTNTIDTSKWDLTKVDIVYDTANVAVPVPKGYVASGADGEHTVNTGFVIYEGTGEVTNDNEWNESCTRNQWVWVPVPDVNRIYELHSSGKKKSKLYEYYATERKPILYNATYENSDEYGSREPGVLACDNEEYFAQYGLQGMTSKKFLNELEEEFNDTIESIQTYGGFWIGRYETGNLSAEEPVIQRMNTDIDEQDEQNWYTEYIRIKRMSTGDNVKTSMIWGCLWDETLQWFVDSGCKTYGDIYNSILWGNYRETSFRYKTNINGDTSTSSNTMIPTGSTEYSNANNVYDMAGNAEEWTLEVASTTQRYSRGESIGCTNFGHAHSAAERTPSWPDRENGVRAFLYIK